MQLEAIRQTADWLSGATNPAYSANALLSAVPRYTGHAAPTAYQAVRDASRHGWCARRALPREGSGEAFPLLAVMLAGDLEMQGEVQTAVRDAKVSLLIVDVEDEVDTEAAIVSGSYRLRAVVRSLKQYHDPANAAARRANDISLMVCSSIREIPVGMLPQLGVDIRCTAALLVSYDVRDMAP